MINDFRIESSKRCQSHHIEEITGEGHSTDDPAVAAIHDLRHFQGQFYRKCRDSAEPEFSPKVMPLNESDVRFANHTLRHTYDLYSAVIIILELRSIYPLHS